MWGLSSDASGYLIRETAKSSFINGAVSGGLTLLVFGSQSEITVWGPPSFALDFIPQTFMGALMSVIIPTIVSRKLRQTGKLPPISPRAIRLPKNAVLRGAIAGLAGCIALCLPVILALLPFAEHSFQLPAAIAIKVLYGVVVPCVFTPLSILAAMADD
jgi:hypothetical protein